MDPNATWKQMAQAVSSGNWDEAGDLADALMDWISAQGFPPTITGEREFDLLVTRSTCESLCAWDI